MSPLHRSASRLSLRPKDVWQEPQMHAPPSRLAAGSAAAEDGQLAMSLSPRSA